MKRLPLGATLLTLIVVPILIGFGVWQLERREWKNGLIAQLDASSRLPEVRPAEFFRAMAGETSLQYRRAEIDCRPGRVAPYGIKGGTSADGQGGFLILVSCRDPARTYTRGPDLIVVAGWTVVPDRVQEINLDMSFRGTLIERPYGTEAGRPQFMLIPDTAVPPLLPSRIPVPGDLPNSHLSYAFQWFAFAATLMIIYAIYARDWRARKAVANQTSTTSA